ncbi:hypothetical protein BDQ17DRAFT_1355479, partial [Cyathus striatus]
MHLSSLSLDVPKLDLWLLSLLSKEIPHVKSLRLDSSKIDHLLVGLQSRCPHAESLDEWKLNDLSLYYKMLPLDNTTMKEIAQLIPSIKSFWGTGDMDSPPESRCKQWSHSQLILDL